MITQPEVGPLAVRWDPGAVGSAMTWVAAAYLVLLAGRGGGRRRPVTAGPVRPGVLSLGFLRRSGPWRWAGVLLLGSGATSILAFAFLGAGWDTVHFLSTLSSAVLTVPLAVVAMVIGRALRRELVTR